jgi:type IV pilus assembly protein PilV
MEEVIRRRDCAQRGITLVEVLVTLVILAIGLLGLVALQARVQVLQAEAYQRAQALMLLKDMAGRLANNRNNAAEYVTDADAPVGTGVNCANIDLLDPRAEADLIQWCTALQGAGEALGAANVGAMLGGRGCVEDAGSGAFLISVAWQGLAALPPPPSDPDAVITPPACASGLYNGDEGPCIDDQCRRVATTVVIIPDLT